MGGRIQEIARLRTIEFLIEQAIVLGVGHQAITGHLDCLLATIRENLSDSATDDDEII